MTIIYIVVAVLTAAILFEYFSLRKLIREQDDHTSDCFMTSRAEIINTTNNSIMTVKSEMEEKITELKDSIDAINALIDDADLKSIIEQHKDALEQSEKVMDGISNILSYKGITAAREAARKKGDT